MNSTISPVEQIYNTVKNYRPILKYLMDCGVIETIAIEHIWFDKIIIDEFSTDVCFEAHPYAYMGDNAPTFSLPYEIFLDFDSLKEYSKTQERITLTK